MGVSAHRRSGDDTTNSAPRTLALRLRIYEGLAFLGIDVDEERNRTHATVVSPANGPGAVRVIPTN